MSGRRKLIVLFNSSISFGFTSSGLVTIGDGVLILVFPLFSFADAWKDAMIKNAAVRVEIVFMVLLFFV